jgi:hypothetical protein
MREGTADRSLVKRFQGVGRTALKNHRTGHVTGLGRDARPNARGGRPPKAPALPAVDPVKLDNPEAVMAEYAQLYMEARVLLEQAKAGGDLVRIEKAIGACSDVLDRFAKQFGLFSDGGTTVHVDARSIRIDLPPELRDAWLAYYEGTGPKPEVPITLADGGKAVVPA